MLNILTDFVFLCALGSKNMDSAHSIPELGHSCKAFAIIELAMSFIPALISTLMASSHNSSFFGFFKRAFSNTERALMRRSRFSSSLDNNNHSGIDPGHFLICKHNYQYRIENIIIESYRNTISIKCF